MFILQVNIILSVILSKGNFVASLADSANTQRKSELIPALEGIISELCFLGEEKDELISIIEKIYAKKEETL